MTPLTAEKIAELERLLASARVLPWENGDGDPESILCAADYACVAVTNMAFTDSEDNARLIVAAVNALPYFISLAKRVAGAPVVEVEAVDVDGESYVATFTDGLFTKGTRVALVEIVGGEEG